MQKLKILLYNSKFPNLFERQKKRISKAIENDDIYHIGSTAIPELGGKGIIDIMIGIKNWRETKDIVKKLKKIGFRHVHPREKGRLFLSKHRKPTPDNVHIHIVRKGNKLYKELLFFRNYLRKNKKEAKKLFKLKLKCLREGKGDRKRYTELKENYIKQILKKRK